MSSLIKSVTFCEENGGTKEMLTRKTNVFLKLKRADPVRPSTVSNLPQRQSEPLFSEEEEADGDEEDISPILPTSDEEHSDLESALSSLMPKRMKATSITAPTPSTLSCVSSISSTSRRKKKSQSETIDKLDVLLMEMTKQMNSTDEEIRTVTANTEARTPEDDFFVMISRRVRMMSANTQLWMENQVWDLYMQARRDQAGMPVMGANTGTAMINATYTPALMPGHYSQTQNFHMNHTDNTQNTQTLTQLQTPSQHSQQQHPVNTKTDVTGILQYP
ncbi:uncharacterized protein LOC121390400 isoform X2 [Gigantopelta aegis]|uniref:uncharacterized protein LOC121390400 isoform X2 n=1 Tax=Gigantopelta aegis TaxID=1735272 RepID=UPI001B88C248|nr:uncharacterized protein LOC121390400 isoform X2 [Gigantopelta aegis]